MNTKVVTLRLDGALEKKLVKLARSTHRSRSLIAAEAIGEYVAVNEWQIDEIGQALKEADRGEFVGDREVRKVMRTWTKNARYMASR